MAQHAVGGGKCASMILLMTELPKQNRVALHPLPVNAGVLAVGESTSRRQALVQDCATLACRISSALDTLMASEVMPCLVENKKIPALHQHRMRPNPFPIPSPCILVVECSLNPRTRDFSCLHLSSHRTGAAEEPLLVPWD